ncbi:MAG: hypothetical protein O7F73_15185 [Gammaproteobacteria bacterium]|nr:hypothetical protein [Gammaproteobacteria bacterium]
MITRFDDYCIHQTAQPIAQPSQSDRNFYDRYWFNGMDSQGSYLFEAGLGLYPNRHIMDGHFSVTIGDRQYAFHGSRRAPRERGETVVGPLAVEIVQPMRQVRVRLAANEHNIECDLLFTAASIPHEEPPNVMYDGGHLIMHNSRFTQMGYWEGYFQIDGERFEVRRVCGTRDKSWGVRPVGEPQGGAPGLLSGEPGVYWCWNPINFGDVCTQMGTFEDRDGKPTEVSADLLPLYDNPDAIPEGEDPGLIEMVEVSHTIDWEKGTRRAAAAEVKMADKAGNEYTISLQPLLRFQMLGVGYNHAEWGHGFWKGELETAREEWDLEAMNPLEYQNLHVHQGVRAQMGERVGLGTLETIVIGRHERSGFKDLLDGAS